MGHQPGDSALILVESVLLLGLCQALLEACRRIECRVVCRAGRLAIGYFLLKRRPRNKDQPFRLAVAHYLFGRAIGNVVSILDGNDGRYLAGALDLVECDVRHADVTDLALLAQAGESSDRLLV